MNNEWKRELEEHLHKFARFVVIGFKGVKEGKEPEYFDDYVKNFTSSKNLKSFIEKTLHSEREELRREKTAKEYLTELLLETENYDAVSRKRLKHDLNHFRS